MMKAKNRQHLVMAVMTAVIFLMFIVFSSLLNSALNYPGTLHRINA